MEEFRVSNFNKFEIKTVCFLKKKRKVFMFRLVILKKLIRGFNSTLYRKNCLCTSTSSLSLYYCSKFFILRVVCLSRSVVYSTQSLIDLFCVYVLLVQPSSVSFAHSFCVFFFLFSPFWYFIYE